MEIRQLQLFVALAEEGNFTRASQRMRIVQSGLSTSIKELERELKAHLFNRTTRRVELTAKGKVFLAHARESLAALEVARQSVLSRKDEIHGRLRIGILHSLLPYVSLPLAVQKFNVRYPHVVVDLKHSCNLTVPTQIQSGDFDLSFYSLVGQTRWPGLRVVPFMEDTLVAICSKKHALAKGTTVQLEMLVQKAFVDLTPELALREIIDRSFLRGRMVRSSVAESNDPLLACDLVAHNVGVAIVPTRLAMYAAQERPLHILQLSPSKAVKLPTWRLAILSRKRQDMPKEPSFVDVFLNLLDSSAVQPSKIPALRRRAVGTTAPAPI